MMRCGACGLMITAENKINRFGSRYTYYHCTKRRLGPRCSQPYVELKALEGQIRAFLEQLYVPEHVHQVAVDHLRANNEADEEWERTRRRSLAQLHQEVCAQLDQLTDLRLRGLLDDHEFVNKRQQLQRQQLQLSNADESRKASTQRFELLDDVLFFSSRATEWLQRDDPQTKKLILETVGSNFLLTDKILSIQARKPFLRRSTGAKFGNLLAFVDDVRTSLPDDPAECELIRRNIRMLRDRFGAPIQLQAAA
jgi:hypothetical protein